MRRFGSSVVLVESWNIFTMLRAYEVRMYKPLFRVGTVKQGCWKRKETGTSRLII